MGDFGAGLSASDELLVSTSDKMDQMNYRRLIFFGFRFNPLEVVDFE